MGDKRLQNLQIIPAILEHSESRSRIGPANGKRH